MYLELLDATDRRIRHMNMRLITGLVTEYLCWQPRVGQSRWKQWGGSLVRWVLRHQIHQLQREVYNIPIISLPNVSC